MKVLSYLWPILVLGGAAFLLYRVDRKVERVPTQRVVQKETRVVKKVVVEKCARPPTQVDNPVAPIVRIRRYKPNPPREPLTWAEKHSSWPVWPKRLQWWERKEVVPVAKVLMQGGYLQKFHTLLGREILRMADCPRLGNDICYERIAVMRKSIDAFLKNMMEENGQKLELSWWCNKDCLHYIASLTLFSNNLEKLYVFIGRQLGKLGRCSILTRIGCRPRRAKAAKAISNYFKKMVIDHGGPLIDRNWDTY
jgi:hypothetical protein